MDELADNPRRPSTGQWVFAIITLGCAFFLTALQFTFVQHASKATLGMDTGIPERGVINAAALAIVFAIVLAVIAYWFHRSRLIGPAATLMTLVGANLVLVAGYVIPPAVEFDNGCSFSTRASLYSHLSLLLCAAVIVAAAVYWVRESSAGNLRSRIFYAVILFTVPAAFFLWMFLQPFISGDDYFTLRHTGGLDACVAKV